MTRTRTRKQAAPQVLDVAEAQEIDGDDPEQLSAFLAEFDGELGENWWVELYRVAEKGERGGYIRKVDLSELPEIRDWLRDNAGSGLYSALIKQKGIIRRRLHFRILSLEKRSAAQPAPAAPAAETTLVVLLRQMEERAARRDQLMMEILRAGRGGDDKLQELERLSAIFSNINGNRNQSSADTALNLVLKGMEMGKMASDGATAGGEGVSLSGMLRDVLTSPVVGELVQGLRTAAIPNHAQLGPAAVPGPQPVPLAAPPGRGFDLAAQLQFLVARARAGNDPEIYAEMLADIMPQEHIKGLLESADPLTPLEVVQPAMGEHRPWFVALLDSLRQIMSGEEEPMPGEDEEISLEPGASPSAITV